MRASGSLWCSGGALVVLRLACTLVAALLAALKIHERFDLYL
jgi:hypothetical protein